MHLYRHRSKSILFTTVHTYIHIYKHMHTNYWNSTKTYQYSYHPNSYTFHIQCFQEKRWRLTEYKCNFQHTIIKLLSNRKMRHALGTQLIIRHFLSFFTILINNNSHNYSQLIQQHFHFSNVSLQLLLIKQTQCNWQ